MCEHIKLPGGVTAIVCGVRHNTKFCACGRPADMLCDWKVSGKRSGTCDRPICRDHALQVAPEKHLCQEHQKAFADWKKRHPNVAIERPKQVSLPLSPEESTA